MNFEEDFLKRAGRPDTPEYRLALKIAMFWVEAIKFDDFDWMNAHIKEMERLKPLEHLERLQKLYDWSKSHPVKRRTEN